MEDKEKVKEICNLINYMYDSNFHGSLKVKSIKSQHIKDMQIKFGLEKLSWPDFLNELGSFIDSNQDTFSLYGITSDSGVFIKYMGFQVMIKD